MIRTHPKTAKEHVGEIWTRESDKHAGELRWRGEMEMRWRDEHVRGISTRESDKHAGEMSWRDNMEMR
jgi:hypothetical protein